MTSQGYEWCVAIGMLVVVVVAFIAQRRDQR